MLRVGQKGACFMLEVGTKRGVFYDRGWDKKGRVSC